MSPFKTSRYIRPYFDSVCLAVVCILTIFCHTARADSFNATISGDLTALKNLLAASNAKTCDSHSCRIPSPAIRLSLRAPHFARINVALVEAKMATPVRSSGNLLGDAHAASSQAPILLTGYSQISSEQKIVPVAATIYRDGANPILEVALPQRPSRGTHDTRGGVVFRSPITTLLTTRQRNARAQAPPVWALGERACGVGDIGPSHNKIQPAVAKARVQGSSLFNVLYIGTDYDSQFASQVGCRKQSTCHNKILSMLHKAAVFYQNQVGYTFEVVRQFGPTQLSRTTASEVLLDIFQQYNFDIRSSYMHDGTNTQPEQVDGLQLFTGRKMDGDTIGIAYVATTCRNDQSRFSASIVQRVSDVVDPVTIAHELGHTLSAEHTATGIMRPALGRNPPTTFESSSLLLISSYLSQWYPECRQGTSEGHTGDETPPSGGGSSNPFRGKPITVDLMIQSSGPQSLTITTTTSQVRTDCAVKLHASTSSAAAPRGTVISNVVPVEPSITKTGSVQFRVNPGSSKNPYIYFVAEHTCTDGTILEVSRVRKVNPNRIKGLLRRQRSKRSWIKDFGATLR
jgi:hypothetical protein